MTDYVKGSAQQLLGLASPQNVTAGSGSNRLLIVAFQYETSGTSANKGTVITACTYGGQSLTRAFASTHTSSETDPTQKNDVWYLNDAGIVAGGGGTQSLAWTFSPIAVVTNLDMVILTVQDASQTPTFVTDFDANDGLSVGNDHAFDAGAQSPTTGSLLLLLAQANSTVNKYFVPDETWQGPEKDYDNSYTPTEFDDTFEGNAYENSWMRLYDNGNTSNCTAAFVRKVVSSGQSVPTSGWVVSRSSGTIGDQPGVVSYIEIPTASGRVDRPLIDAGTITARHEEELVVYGTGFDSTCTVTINSQSQTTGYIDRNKIVIPFVDRGNSAYGTGFTLAVTRVSDGLTASSTTCSLLPPTGASTTGYRTVATPFAGAGDRITCLSGLANGEQIAWRGIAAPSGVHSIDVAADTTITTQAGSTVTISTTSTTEHVTHSISGLRNLQEVRFSATTTMPSINSVLVTTGTSYYVINKTDTICFIATSLHNAIRGIYANFTGAGSGVSMTPYDSMLGVWFEAHNGSTWARSGWEALGTVADPAGITHAVRISDTKLRLFGVGFNSNLTAVRLRVESDNTILQDFTPTIINDGVCEITLSLSTVPWPVDEASGVFTASGHGIVSDEETFAYDNPRIRIEALAKNGATVYTAQTCFIRSDVMYPPRNNRVVHMDYAVPAGISTGSLLASVSGAARAANDQIEYTAFVTSDNASLNLDGYDADVGESGYVGADDTITAQWRWWSNADKSWTGWSDVAFDASAPAAVANLVTGRNILNLMRRRRPD